MNRRMTYVIRLTVLVLYSVYAMSPIYLSTTVTRRTAPESCAAEANDVTLGIVWVNFVLTALIDRSGDYEGPSKTNLSSGDQDNDLLLIKKKRAVLRDAHDLRPVVQVSLTLANDDDAIVPSLPASNISRDLRHRLSDSPHFLHIGISPPLRFV